MVRTSHVAAGPLEDAALASEFDRLAALSLPGLRADWARRWGEAPSYRSADQIRRALAYRLQVEVQGGLSRRARRDLVQLAARFEEDRGFDPTPSVSLKPGSALIREWGGCRHEVAVIDGGFAYNGARFSSLSQVAQAITGTKWNGPVFFGVKVRKTAKAVSKARA